MRGKVNKDLGFFTESCYPWTHKKWSKTSAACKLRCR